MSHNLLSEQMNQELINRVEELFSSGLNCCESILKAFIEEMNLPLPPNTYLMGKFFREGVAGSGCICGALAGGTMLLGFLYGETQEGLNMAKAYREQFVGQFGSSCCRVLRKKQTFIERISRKQCRNITGYSARILLKIIDDHKDCHLFQTNIKGETL